MYYVVTEPGSYHLDVSSYFEASTGRYDMEVVVARPGLEAAPVGTAQTVFLDFDGATIDFDTEFSFPDPDLDVVTFAPLVDSLADWGLSADDLDAVIDETVARLTVKLSTFIRANGLNGDYDRSRKPGEFDIRIENSRDHRFREGRDPYTSRIVIGGTDNSLLSDEYIGLASFIDVGNFKADDQAVVTTKFVGQLLDAFELAEGASVIDFAAEYLSVLAAHEFGHLVGCYHTQYSDEGNFAEPVTLMDKLIYVPLGPDFVFGTEDDITMQFGVDAYATDEFFTGVNDTLNTVAFGLSSGTRHGSGHGNGGHGHGRRDDLERIDRPRRLHELLRD